MKNIVGEDNMIQFNALSIYNNDNRYTDIMLYDELPQEERDNLTQQVADKVLSEARQVL